MPAPPWNPTTTELDAYADRHIHYEVRMLLVQIRLLHERYPRGPTNPAGDALIESPLVHLRLFDDFFRAVNPRDDDVIARHWDSTWTPVDVLTDQERSDINAHAHLVARRGRTAAWQPRLHVMALRFCDVFEAFVAGLANRDADRAKAFDRSLTHVTSFRKWVAKKRL